MYSIQAAQKMKKESLDFVYIDARHDFCAMMEDLEAYWPLVAPGGILAGHDYMSSPEVGMNICGSARAALDILRQSLESDMIN